MKKVMEGFSLRAKSLLMASLFFAGLSACDEVKEAAKINPEAETSAAESQAEMAMNFEDISVIAAEAMQKAFEGAETGRSLASYTRINCAEFEHNEAEKTITLDFGDGCVGEAGRERKGKVLINYTGNLFVSGTEVTITLQDFYIDGIQVEATKTITNVTEGTDTPLEFEVVVTDGKVTWPDGEFATRNIEHTRTWIRNQNPLTDELHIEGTAEGVRKDGEPYEISIESPIIYKVDCFMEEIYIPVGGIQWIKTPEKPDVILNYGTGECDKEVTITVNSISTTIEID